MRRFETYVKGIHPRTPVFSHEIAQFYSDLRKRGDAGGFETLMKQIFDQIEALSPEQDAGNWVIHARMKNTTRFFPLYQISDGINRAASVLLNVAARARGVVCVDEIDSGLYFGRQQAFWRALADYCIKNNTGIFASTHSLEALRSMVPAMRENADRFALIRVYRDGGLSHAAMVPGKDGLALIESGLEVR